MPGLSNEIIKNADALELRLLIYISKFGEAGLKEIIKDLDITLKDAISALSFLQRNSLIYISNINGQEFYCPIQNSVKKSSEMPKYDNEIIERNLKENDYLKFLAYKSEQKIGRPLSISELRILFGTYDWLKLPVEVILMLVDYCCETDKKNLKYLEKIAVQWSKLGITSIEAAQRHLKEIKDNSIFMKKIKDILNLGDKELSLTDKKYINKWEQADIKEHQILDAYEKTMKNTGKCAFAYMNKIIMSDTDKKDTKRLCKSDFTKTLVNKKSRFDFDEVDRLDFEFLKKFEDREI
jgi:DnaD/phage-associated family protein